MVLFEAGSILSRLLGQGSVAATPTNTVISLLWIGLIAAIVTAGSGWVYAADLADDSRETLFLHRWTGISATSVALLAVIAAIVACRKPSHRTRSV